MGEGRERKRERRRRWDGRWGKEMKEKTKEKEDKRKERNKMERSNKWRNERRNEVDRTFTIKQIWFQKLSFRSLLTYLNKLIVGIPLWNHRFISHKRKPNLLHCMLFFNKKMVSTIFIYLHCELLFLKLGLGWSLGEEMKQCEGVTWNFLCAPLKGEQVGLTGARRPRRNARGRIFSPDFLTSPICHFQKSIEFWDICDFILYYPRCKRF